MLFKNTDLGNSPRTYKNGTSEDETQQFALFQKFSTSTDSDRQSGPYHGPDDGTTAAGKLTPGLALLGSGLPELLWF